MTRLGNRTPPTPCPFWSGVVGAPGPQFRKSTIKTHNARTVGKNVGTRYHGCLVVYVRNSTALNVEIEGWCEGLAAAVSGTLEQRSGMV